jgi:membrane protein
VHRSRRKSQHAAGRNALPARLQQQPSRSGQAAKLLAFAKLLAIFPAIAALVALYGLFADLEKIASHLDAAPGVLPSGAFDAVRDQMNRDASQGHTKLGLAFIIGFSVSLWSANAGMKSIFDALNLVYD